jgi:hypothetical protein
LARSGILPRWRWCHCGASVVTAPGAVATEKDPQMSHNKIPRKTEVARAKSRAKRPAKPGPIPSGSSSKGPSAVRSRPSSNRARPTPKKSRTSNWRSRTGTAPGICSLCPSPSASRSRRQRTNSRGRLWGPTEFADDEHVGALRHALARLAAMGAHEREGSARQRGGAKLGQFACVPQSLRAVIAVSESCGIWSCFTAQHDWLTKS